MLNFLFKKNKNNAVLELPPKSLRFMNEDDEKFAEIGRVNIELLQSYGLDETSSILDLGSGYGRLAIALHKKFPDFSGNYVGVDILPKHISWCQENIESKLKNYKFNHLNVVNDRYNPKGNIEANKVKIDYKPLKFNLACLFSVFTHMYEEDIKHYLSQIHKNLKEEGLCIATFFIYDDERLEKINAREEGYNMKYELNDHTRYYSPEDKLHAISFKKDFIEKMCRDCGFNVEKVVYGDWASGGSGYYQDYVVLRKLL